MTRHYTSLNLALCTLLAATPLAALAQTLNPAAQRISDTAIHADYQTYEATQGRIKALNDGGRRVRDYHLSKAQCWLDVSFHEYTRNDRSAFPQEALDQSVRLIALMEQKASPLPMDTPLVNGADTLRPDLWEAAQQWKTREGFQCVAQRVSCAEVELVHAGNEHKQQACRHAKPYVQIAEDLLAQAEQEALACVAKPVAPVIALAPVLPPEVKPPQAVEFQANVLFNHDRYQRSEARKLTLDRLDQALARARESGTRLKQIQLIGHADRTGNVAYNQALSSRRVQTVQQYLLDAGVDAKLLQTTVKGDTLQVTACEGKFKTRAEELECLLPNRRVEVNFIAEK
jgi:OOP family OmpA-OmpF porin